MKGLRDKMKSFCHFDNRREEKSPEEKPLGWEISLPLVRIRDDNPVFLLRTLSIVLLIVLFFSSTTHAQDKPKVFRYTGFVEYLNNSWIPYGETNKMLGFEDWQNQSGIYNRFNFWVTPVKNLEFYVGMRNNFLFGPLVASYNDLFSGLGLNYTYNDLATFDNGYVDLTFKIADGDSYVLYTNFDRANLKWTLKKFELTVGRQRINWGTNLIWNPNDIFNAYNYLDFNYVERPGSDAVLMEFFTGDFSSVQLAAKVGNNLIIDKFTGDSLYLKKQDFYTVAAMYRFNLWSYDFQFFGGKMEDDFTAGAGWAGSIAGAGFTGEISWFRDIEHFSDSSNTWIASIGINYTFRNSIFINFSGIYNSAGATGPANAGIGNFFGSFTNMFSSSLNVKNLTRSRMNVFGQISYPATPLINLDLASIFNPYDKSIFVGPSINFSLTDNINLMLVGQLFWGDPLTEYGDIGQMFFLDLKWSF